MRSDIHKFWTGLPPWILIGAAAVLLPLFTFMTLEDINRQKAQSVKLLQEKGAALIRSFEAGTRTGMMRMGRGFKLQHLLIQTAMQPDIVYILVVEKNGMILAHGDAEQVGKPFKTDLDLAELSRLETVRHRIVDLGSGEKVFEVFRKFSPAAPDWRRRRRHNREGGPSQGRGRGMGRGYGMGFGRMLRDGMRHHHAGEDGDENMLESPEMVIFVGLDMAAVEAARKADTIHSVVMAIVLLLIGFAGITALFLAHGYKTTRASLTRVKALSDTLIANMPIGLLAVGREQKIVAVNAEAESVLGLAASRVRGKSARGVLSGELMDILDRLAAGEGHIEEEVDLSNRQAPGIVLEVTASSIADEAGTPMGFALLFKDLTEVRSLRKEIASSRRMAAIGRLAAGVAHEIRNPLSSIKGFATYFRERYEDSPDDRETAGIMIQEVERLNRVVGQLLELSRPMTIRKEPIRINDLIRDTLLLVEQKTRDAGITVRMDPSGSDTVIRVDRDRISQVFLNLMLNAVESIAEKNEDASGQNGNYLDISVNSAQAGTRITMSDTGVGIQEAEVSKVFDPFYTSKSTGTGLGLSIVHNIMEAHGGSARIESRPGEGASIILDFPRGKGYEHDE